MYEIPEIGTKLSEGISKAKPILSFHRVYKHAVGNRSLYTINMNLVFHIFEDGSETCNNCNQFATALRLVVNKLLKKIPARCQQT